MGFPIKNKTELVLLAKNIGIDFTLLLTQKERFKFIEDRSKINLFNDVITIISRLIDFDLIVFLGSDKRVNVVEKLFSIQVIGIEIGKSPITEDQFVNPEMILEILREVKVFSADRRQDR